MKLQFNALVTLAVLYGSVVAIPVPENAAIDVNIPDDVLSTLGKLLGIGFAGIVPSSALKGAAQGAGAHLNRNFVLSRDVAEVDDSISDAVLSTLGKLLGTGFAGIVPGSALQGAAQGAGARLNRNRFYSRDEAEVDDSISDAVLSTLGKLLGAGFAGIVPGSALQGAAQGAGAHLNRNFVLSRDVAEVDDSISDAVLSTLGKLLGAGFAGIVPGSALQGAAQGAGAHLNRNFVLSRDVAEVDDSISDEVLSTLGKLLGAGFAGIVPGSALQGAAQGAGAHLNRNRFFSRDEAEVDDSISDAVLSTLGKLLGAGFAGIVPGSALQGAAQGAGAHLNRNFVLSRDVAEVDDSISDAVLSTLGKLLGAGFAGIVPGSALQGAAQGAGAHLNRNFVLSRDVAEANDSISDAVLEN